MPNYPNLPLSGLHLVGRRCELGDLVSSCFGGGREVKHWVPVWCLALILDSARMESGYAGGPLSAWCAGGTA